MAACRNFAFVNGFKHSATFFGSMGAGGKTAIARKGLKLPKTVNEIVLQNILLFKGEGGKAGGIGYVSAVGFKKLNRSGCVPSAAKLSAYFARCKLGFGEDKIKQA